MTGQIAESRAPDGRTLRAERTRARIVDALLQLIDGGELSPTAEGIAAQAGISTRTVFQHFPDRELLIAAASAAQERRIRRLVEPIDVALPLPERIAALVAQRARVLEALTPMRRLALRLAPASPQVAERLAMVRAAGRAQLEEVFAAEVAARPRAERDLFVSALFAAAAWPTWETLRADEGLDEMAAAAVMRRLLAGVLGE